MAGAPEITAFTWVPPFAQGLVRDTRARWAFEEVGLDYDVRLLDLGEHKSAAHRALQPFGQIPTYAHGDTEIFESGAIVLHIAGLKPGLLPGDPAGDARATAWLISALNSVEPMIFDLVLADLFDKDEAYAPLFRPKAIERLRARLADLSNALGDKRWLDGDVFTAGDLIMVSVLRGLRHTDLVAEHDNLAAYLARGESRPAFQKALADHMAVFEGVKPPAWYSEGESK
ncbi:glutathione S-transferase family protein [Sphingobium boeckii]|uniref:Glutathione S-transferase n=1 Tax=Sphingobium boeckii TaxID=1082345 RepID=A0A7W9EEA8_9SPHN|nr:glutathione S-transferase family protein [Sphingobium boeckii]MBB5684486.1 glutathione S-transferase [Sphingobium boeckii]